MKAILILNEMPSQCIECPFHTIYADDMSFTATHCTLTAERNEDGVNTRAEWCPLKPMPEKRELHQYVGDRCYHCRFFNGEKSSVGIACTNPIKEWRTRTAKYKQPSMKACKMFERKQEE